MQKSDELSSKMKKKFQPGKAIKTARNSFFRCNIRTATSRQKNKAESKKYLGFAASYKQQQRVEEQGTKTSSVNMKEESSI